MTPKLFAFDLDGTLLTSDKKLSPANTKALREMEASGAIVAFASGRLGSSMARYAPELNLDLAMLTLNGAAVYMGPSFQSKMVYHAPLPVEFSDHLLEYAADKPFALNFYYDDKLYSMKNSLTERWIDLYYQQTHTTYQYVEKLGEYNGVSPSKIIFVGDPKDMDSIENHFRSKWGDTLYICRTWDYYLEFLSAKANKGNGLDALAKAYNVDLSEVVAFGDANNDIPMLERAGLGIAMKNAEDEVKASARHVSQWTNDEDGVAREWERIKSAL